MIKLWDTDQYVEDLYLWLIARIGESLWRQRRTKIQKELKKIVDNFFTSTEKDLNDNLLSSKSDKVGWYLYLVECYLYLQDEYEFLQGSRVIPYFSILGENLENLKKINNFEHKIDNFLREENKAPDQDIFEFLVALLYIKSGYEEVTFIKESPPNRTPDIYVRNRRYEYYVECKRFSKDSGYHGEERKAWYKIWTPFSRYLLSKNKYLIMDIVFHIEILELDEKYLINKVRNKINEFSSGTLIQDDEVTITAKPFNKKVVNDFLNIEPLKVNSPKLINLITGSYDPLKGLSILACYKHGRVDISGTNINNIFTEKIDFAITAFRSFDSPESINKKARDIKKRVSEAEKQIPKGKRGIIHVGVETLEGNLTTKQRFDKILHSTIGFKVSEDKEIDYILCHFLQPESSPDEIFGFAETTAYFPSRSSREHIENLLSCRLFGSDKAGDGKPDSVHWEE